MTKKAFVIDTIPQTTLVCIRYEGGGEVPAELQGTFTTRQLAKDAITFYAYKRDGADSAPEVVDVVEEKEKALQERRGPGRPKKEPQPIA